MKLHKKIAAILSAALVVASSSAFSAGAVVTVSDGTYQYTYSNGEWGLYAYLGSDTELTLPESFGDLPVTSIASRCFAHTGLTSVSIPDSYAHIGSYAFYDCQNLQNVRFSSSLTAIDMGAFAESGLTAADLSDTKITSVSDYLFQNCETLKTVTLPDSLTRLGTASFRNSGITALTLPKGVTAIGESCFETSALQTIFLPESLETIGASAFRGDAGMTELYIPEAVSNIGAYALYPMSVQSTLEVQCIEDSYAAQYCYENFVMDYHTYAHVFGDANLDGSVNIADATQIQMYCAGYLDFKQIAQAFADVNNDSRVSVEDVTLIQRYVAGYDDGIL